MNRKAKALEFVNAEYHIHITGRNFQITDYMRDYAMDKISKIERFMNRIIDINIIMEVQKIYHRVEIIFKAGSIKFRSLASSTDMYVSIDQAIDKLESQILRYKSRLQDHHAISHADLDSTVDILSEPTELEKLGIEEDAFDSEPYKGFEPHQIVKEETIPLKILRYDEAIKKMDQTDMEFFIFKDERDQKLKVIYRLKDDNYGIIEPKC